MDRLMPVERYRLQARVCAGMAIGSPSDTIRRLWLELAEQYERVAEAMRSKPGMSAPAQSDDLPPRRV
jgi:hypothetical protein